MLNDTPWHVTVSEPANADAFLADYESNEDLDAEFRTVASVLRPLAMDFSCFEPARELLVRFLLAQGGEARRFWLDTDYGWVVRGDQLLERVKTDETWDWRCEPTIYLK